MRDSIERPEALDAGAIVMTSLDATDVERAIPLVIAGRDEPTALPIGYEVADTSRRVVRFIASTVGRHAAWLGLRTWDGPGG